MKTYKGYRAGGGCAIEVHCGALATLHSQRCGRVQTATAGDLATHLGRGWPMCHGETMHLGDAPSN